MTTSDKFQRHSLKVAFKLTAKSVRSHILTFGIFENRIAGLGSYEDLIIGAGAGAGAGMLPRSRSRSRSRPKISRLRIPGFYKCSQKCSFLLRRRTRNLSFNPRPTGGGGYFEPPSRFLAISSKPMQVAPPNLQYPLSQHFYTLC